MQIPDVSARYQLVSAVSSRSCGRKWNCFALVSCILRQRANRRNRAEELRSEEVSSRGVATIKDACGSIGATQSMLRALP